MRTSGMLSVVNRACVTIQTSSRSTVQIISTGSRYKVLATLLEFWHGWIYSLETIISANFSEELGLYRCLRGARGGTSFRCPMGGSANFEELCEYSLWRAEACGCCFRGTGWLLASCAF